MKYLKTIGNLHNVNRDFMMEFLRSRSLGFVKEFNPFISSENIEKFKILELKTTKLVQQYEELSPRPPICQTLGNDRRGHFLNIFYVILVAMLAVILYFALCFDGVVYENIVNMINVKFKGHYELSAIQRKATVLLSDALRPQELKFDYGTLSELQEQIKAIHISPVLQQDLFGYFQMLDKFNFDEKFYDLCTITFMEEFVMILDICKSINSQTTIDSSYSIANQLAQLEVDRSSTLGDDDSEPKPPYKSGSSFKGLYYLNSRNLQTQVIEKLNQFLNAIYSGTISPKNAGVGFPIVDTLISNYLHVSYLADFIHHFTVKSLDFLLPKSEPPISTPRAIHYWDDHPGLLCALAGLDGGRHPEY